MQSYACVLTAAFLVAVVRAVIIIITPPDDRYTPPVSALKLTFLAIRFSPYDEKGHDQCK